tara:strand:+ start:28589 stop:29488 length:900 start_codon:yes stop_codon:yes gene_type:complete
MQHEKEILKWIDGTITDSELTELRKTPEYGSLEPIIKNTANFKKPSFDVEQALAGFNRLKQPKAKVVSFGAWKKYGAIAASILVLASLYFVFSNSNITVSTPYAETAAFILPDASEVLMNSGSKVVYSKKEWNKKRELTLSGEAFFKVSKGKIFDVITNQGIVTVVGTQFNVNEREGYFEVQCYEGKVKVSLNNQMFMLRPGKTIKLVAGELSEVMDFNTEVPDWMNKQSNFENVPFDVVVKELERQFNVKVVYDKSLSNKQFTGGFSHESLKEAIMSIAFPMNLKFDIKDKNLIELYE